MYCRVKPHPSPVVRISPDQSSIAISVDSKDHNFSYDRVYAPGVAQEEVFSGVSELVQSALDGYHVCLFSYGQTGAGKTHTMQGTADPAGRGIIPRAVEKVRWSLGRDAMCRVHAHWSKESTCKLQGMRTGTSLMQACGSCGVLDSYYSQACSTFTTISCCRPPHTIPIVCLHPLHRQSIDACHIVGFVTDTKPATEANQSLNLCCCCCARPRS